MSGCIVIPCRIVGSRIRKVQLPGEGGPIKYSKWDRRIAKKSSGCYFLWGVDLWDRGDQRKTQVASSG